MRDVAPSSGRPTLEKPRARRDAAKVLGVALQTRYRRLLEATGEDETVVATADLAQTMYENIEFVIWALKSLGGMNPPPPEELRKVSAPPPDPRFVTPPPFELHPSEDGEDHNPDGFVHATPEQAEIVGNAVREKFSCTCPPLEAGIIGRDRHMTSCPKFVP